MCQALATCLQLLRAVRSQTWDTGLTDAYNITKQALASLRPYLSLLVIESPWLAYLAHYLKPSPAQGLGWVAHPPAALPCITQPFWLHGPFLAFFFGLLPVWLLFLVPLSSLLSPLPSPLPHGGSIQLAHHVQSGPFQMPLTVLSLMSICL